MGFIQYLIEMQKRLYANLHFFYLFLFAPFALTMCFLMPAMQVQDEFAHFSRAINIAYGQMIDKPKGKFSEAHVPAQLSAFLATPNFSPDFFVDHRIGDPVDTGIPDPKVIHFAHAASGMRLVFAWYPPTSYVFQALGIDAGRLFQANALYDFYLARFFSVIGCLALAFFAIRNMTSGKFLAFCVMGMPMTLSLFASCSQDAALIGFTAFGIGVLHKFIGSNSERPDPNPNPKTVIIYCLFATLFLAMAVAGRPPYIALMGLTPVLLCAAGYRKQALGIMIFGFLLPFLWIYLARHLDNGDEFGSNHKGQIDYIFHNPLQAGGVLIATVASHLKTNTYLRYVIGILGSKNVGMPLAVYTLGFYTLTVALIHDALLSPNRLRFIPRAMIGGLLLCIFVSVYVIGYIYFSPVAAPVISGIQGRYFIPPLLTMTLAVGSRGHIHQALLRRNISPELCSFATFAFLIVGMLAINIAAISTILETYYFTT